MNLTLDEECVKAKRIAKHCTAYSKGEKLVVPAERAIFQVRKCIWFDLKWQEYQLKFENTTPVQNLLNLQIDVQNLIHVMFFGKILWFGNSKISHENEGEKREIRILFQRAYYPIMIKPHYFL